MIRFPEKVMKCALLAPLISAVTLAGCANGDRALTIPHSPVVAGGAATVPGCPDWSDGDVNAGEGMAHNFGCATQMNLAAMIADPQDLVHGKSGPVSAEQIAKALKVWREQVPTGAGALEKVSVKGGGQ